MKQGGGACLETLGLPVCHQAQADSLAAESKSPRKAEPARGLPVHLAQRERDWHGSHRRLVVKLAGTPE